MSQPTLISSQNHPNENNPKALFLLGKYHYEKYALSYGSDDFRTAKNHLEILAEQDNADAQFLLGMLYKAKQGSHSKEAIHWFLKAEQNGVQNATHELNQFHYIKEKAENGCAESLFQLGEYYEFQGFYSLAMECWEKAAHQGCVLAQNKLYDFHKNNHNYIESEYWYTQLSQKEKDKQIELGILHFQLENYEEAIYYLKKIAVGEGEYGEYPYRSFGDIIDESFYGYRKITPKEAIYWLGRIVKRNENIKSYLTKLDEEFISLLYTEKHIFWLEKLAKKGGVTAHIYLMHLYYEQGLFEPASHWYGKSFETGNEQEIKIIWKIYNSPFKYNSLFSDTISYWEEKLAERGYAEAQYEVASKYYYEGDYEKAIEWYEKSAKQGYYWAQYYLGRLLFEEEKDLNQAIYWLYQADLQKNENEIPLEAHPKALKNLTQESWDILLHWYRAFSEKGDYFGQLYLGICYNEGLGVEKDTQKALFCLKKSLEHGCIETFRYLEETKILDFKNPYYEQIRKVEDAQPIKRVFMQEWLSANRELFNTINNEKFEMQFWTNTHPSPIKENQVDYVFFLIFRTFEFLTKYSSEEYATILDEYRSIMETKKKIWVYSPFYRKNIKIPENSEELFKWIFKTDVFSTSPVAIWYPEIRIPDAYQKYIGKSLHLYKPDFKEVLAFDRRKMVFGQLDEFKAYQKSINEQLPIQVLYEQIRRKSV